MVKGYVQHNELPDELLHEPKGASTAAEGTLYIADGAGSGEFKKVPVESLDIAIETVEDLETTPISSTASLVGQGLTQTADGVLTDVQAFIGVPQEITGKINENAAEMLRMYNNQAEINKQIKENITKLGQKINEVIEALRGIGLIDG